MWGVLSSVGVTQFKCIVRLQNFLMLTIISAGIGVNISIHILCRLRRNLSNLNTVFLAF